MLLELLTTIDFKLNSYKNIFNEMCLLAIYTKIYY